MRVWRIAGRRRAKLHGAGARLSGGRWNSKGVSVVYAFGTLSLAVLEKLVHVDPDLIPVGQAVLEIEVPDGLVTTLAPRRLPRGWRRIPPIPATQRLGDAWVAEATSAVLAVPSAVVPTELNYLINPRHPDAAQIKVVRRRPFAFDPRLID
jgi:RES domain-containing protein